MLKLLNFSCSRCSFPTDRSDHFLVNINRPRPWRARRGPVLRAGRAGERMERYVDLATPRSLHCADMG